MQSFYVDLFSHSFHANAPLNCNFNQRAKQKAVPETQLADCRSRCGISRRSMAYSADERWRAICGVRIFEKDGLR